MIGEYIKMEILETIWELILSSENRNLLIFDLLFLSFNLISYIVSGRKARFSLHIAIFLALVISYALIMEYLERIN